MNNASLPSDFWRGISNKDFISDGNVQAEAFQFDQDIRMDGYKELSINWNDCEESLTIALNQRKANGNIQFSGGVAKLQLSQVKQILAGYIQQGLFSFERQEVSGNPYHGNLLVHNSVNKRNRSLISSGLALAAGNNITYQPTSAE